MKQIFYPSDSNSDVTHTVTVYPDNRITCSCRGYRSPNKCWHFRDTAQKLGIDIGIDIGEASKEGPVLAIAIQGSLLETEREIPFKPMLASGMKDGITIADYDSSNWVMEPKIDGHRMVIEIGREITAWSRVGNIRLLPNHIQTQLKQMPYGIFDAELWSPGGPSTDVKSLHLQDSLELALFDVMKVEQASTISLPFSERRKLLESATARITQSKSVCITRQYKPSELELKNIWATGGEGVVLKRLDAIYEIGHRSKTWIKIKKELSVLLTIVGFEAGLLGPYSKVVGVDEFGTEVAVKALNDLWRAWFEVDHTRFIGKKLRINCQEKTRDGRYRHPMADHILDI